MQLAAAALLACGCVSLAEFSDWPRAEEYVAASSCSASRYAQSCSDVRSNWADIFANAIAGKAESQRIVSLCLSTGCDGAIVEKPVLGCAWRHVITASAGSDSAAKDSADLARFCSPERLDETGREAAREQAKSWLVLLGVTAGK